MTCSITILIGCHALEHLACGFCPHPFSHALDHLPVGFRPQPFLHLLQTVGWIRSRIGWVWGLGLGCTHNPNEQQRDYQ